MGKTTGGTNESVQMSITTGGACETLQVSTTTGGIVSPRDTLMSPY